MVVTSGEPNTSYSLTEQSLESARAGRPACALPGLPTRKPANYATYSYLILLYKINRIQINSLHPELDGALEDNPKGQFNVKCPS